MGNPSKNSEIVAQTTLRKNNRHGMEIVDFYQFIRIMRERVVCAGPTGAETRPFPGITHRPLLIWPLLPLAGKILVGNPFSWMP